MSFLKKAFNKSKDLYFDQAQEQGFAQFLKTISVTFFAIPIAWLLIFGLVHQKVPVFPLLLWIGVFFVYWVISVIAFNKGL